MDRPQNEAEPVLLSALAGWHSPGVHRVRLESGAEVWVRMDGRGIATVSSSGPQHLASRPDA